MHHAVKWAIIKEKQSLRKRRITEIFPFKFRLGHRQTSTLQGLHIAVASHQGQGFIPRLRTMHSISQTPAIHSYPASFSLVAWHPNFFNTPSRYQSISSAAYPLSDYQHTLSNPIPLHRSTPSSILSFTPSSLRKTPLSVHSGPYPCFPFCSSFPYVRINCLGWSRGFRPLCLDAFPSLRSSHLSFLLSLLGVDERRPRSVGI